MLTSVDEALRSRDKAIQRFLNGKTRTYNTRDRLSTALSKNMSKPHILGTFVAAGFCCKYLSSTESGRTGSSAFGSLIRQFFIRQLIEGIKQ